MSRKALDQGLGAFLNQWTLDPGGVKKGFLQLLDHLRGQPGATLSFKARPGVSYSLRASRPGGEGTGEEEVLFALIDVIDDDPDQRWLSVCFYETAVSDPAGRGEMIPGGILGEDGYCFNLEGYDPERLAYLRARLDEARTGLPGPGPQV